MTGVVSGGSGVVMVTGGDVAGGGVTVAGDVWSDPVGFSVMCWSRADSSQFG